MSVSKIIKSKYDRLGPNLSLLSDEAVLTQAWKKTDTYIRRHNSYSDMLALDAATVIIPHLIKEWASDILGRNYSPDKMRVVPAPKNCDWAFAPNNALNIPWGFSASPGSKDKHPKLRPLAHVSIRDQTLATAVMLCLADAIETLQGPTGPNRQSKTDPFFTRSYGNRLFCNWRKDREAGWVSTFTWGNSGTFSQYSEDYKKFLARPITKCREISELAATVGTDIELYVIKLDLTSFFDKIDRNKLVDRLKSNYSEYARRLELNYYPALSARFWTRVRDILNYAWDEDDHKLDVLFGRKLPDGLPQGLVASGFFANAYMIDFDAVMSAEPNPKLPNITVIDYSRYVDDIRIVVSVRANSSSSELPSNVKKTVESWVNRELKLYCEGLEPGKILTTNKAKSEIDSWKDIASEGNTSRYMQALQSQVSMGPDAESLKDTSANLSQLLWLADSLQSQNLGKRVKSDLALANITLPRADVRDDIVKRFAAFRLRKTLQLRRTMADTTKRLNTGSGLDTTISEMDEIDYELESTARKLIACWAKNPALVSLLSCAMDMFPSPKLLEPVLEALKSKIEETRKDLKNERATCLYVAADLLRSAVIQTGYAYESKNSLSAPKGSQIEEYRASLEQFAADLVASMTVPWYVLHQAALFLATRNHPVTIPVVPELQLHLKLHNCLKGIWPTDLDIESLPVPIIANNIAGSAADPVLWLIANLETAPDARAMNIVYTCACVDPALLRHMLSRAPRPPSYWKDIATRLVNFEGNNGSSLGNTKRLSLASIISQPHNPFAQENALLKLAEGLLTSLKANVGQDTSIRNIIILNYDSANIQDPSAKLKIAIDNDEPGALSMQSETPSWCREEYAWAYSLGRVLRSAATGNSDFTGRYYASQEFSPRYTGVRSHSFKRRVGLQALTEGLGEEPIPLSPWVSQFIFVLLQWPGLQLSSNVMEDLQNVDSPEDLLLVIKRRLKQQGKVYGRLSQLPVYHFETDCPEKFNPTKFRIGIVQTCLPKLSELKDVNKPDMRLKHRRHLAAMSHLLIEHMTVAKTAGHIEQSCLDLIVFPELSTHPDDILILKNLSTITGAAIFAGQTHIGNDRDDTLINRAVWLLNVTSSSGRRIVKLYQGKEYPIRPEREANVVPYRPYQIVVRFRSSESINCDGAQDKYVDLTGAICYDATDLKLAADMVHVSDAFVVAALNNDINTFDQMTTALQYHMFQPFILANTGEFGGSNAQAPFRDAFRRTIAHHHGNAQAAISLFELDLMAFKSISEDDAQNRLDPMAVKLKTPPAGYKGRPNR